MVTPNKLRDFDPVKFTIYGYCADCGHIGVVPRMDDSTTIPALKASLRCSACGSQDTSIGIRYTDAGEFAWGKSHPNIWVKTYSG